MILQYLYSGDISLLKEMNVNTVRVFTDFYDEFSDNNEQAFAILDKCL